MIRTVGDLLRALITAEKDEMERLSVVGHPGIIGDMYEGLARDVTERTLLPVADLRVVNGKVRNSKGELSRQIDVMVVHGDGERIPYTDHWIYAADQVIAVMEVKKSLYKTDLADAMDLLADFARRVAEPKSVPVNLLRDAWRGIHGSELPSRHELRLLPESDQMLYHSLVVEATQPVRIVIGFEGYRSERALRAGLVDVLTERPKGQGIGPMALPSLVLARDSSLIKLNGMPFGGPYDSTTGAWYFYGSRGVSSMHSFLELLWTRLSYYFGAPSSIFGDDLDLDAVNVLLIGKPALPGGRQGWTIDVVNLSDEDLSQGPDTAPWMPSILSNEAFVIMNQLCHKEEVCLDDKDLHSFAAACGRTVDDLITELRKTGLVYVGEHRRLRLLSDGCACVIVPDVGYVAAENKSGRLERWVFREMAKRRNQKPTTEY
jgi:hypothetical protein